MKIPINWLKEYIDLDADIDDLCEKMTMLGLEIEGVERMGQEIENVVVGHIVSIEPHPDADNLVICKTDTGQEEPAQIVCGAKNMKVGDKVPTVCLGGTLPGGFKIKKPKKIRGVESCGMMCSAKELGLGEEHDGILILDGDPQTGEDIRVTLGLDDVVLEIEVTPNRNDWSGLIGIARELAAAYSIPFRMPEVSLAESGAKASEVSSVTIEDPDLCPRYIGRLLKGVKVGPSPSWLTQRLVAAGQRPINNIVDITNYVLLETGHPLHAFDTKKLNEERIVVRRARAGESIKTLDQEDHKLAEDMLVIADAKVPVAIAGVMGGFDSEVGEGATEIFLESAYFEPKSIRKTARALKMITEASQRFQRGADPEMAEYASQRASQLIVEVAGGELLAGALDEYPQPFEQREITLRYQRTNDMLGVDVPPETQTEFLGKLGFEALSTNAESVTVKVPTWRHDATMEADLIEEVARLYGYENIPSTLPKVRSVEDVYAPEQRVLRALKDYLVSAGLTETVTWTFMSRSDEENAALDDSYGEAVALENPLSEKQAVMRTSLIPGILNIASANIRKAQKNLALFEMGPIYAEGGGEKESARQRTSLAIVLSGLAQEKHWGSPEQPGDVHDLIGYVEGLLEFLGAENIILEPATHPTFTNGHSATIQVNGNAIGVLGRINDAVSEAFEADQPIYLAELNIETLVKRVTKPAQFQEIPSQPASLRDIAVIVDDTVAAGALRDTALKAGGKLLKRVELFDIYTGKPIPDGKKSVALNLSFQSNERTLTDKDTDKAWNKILKALEREFSAELR